MVSLLTRNGVGKRIKKKSKATTRKNAIKAKSGKETQNQNILGSFHRSSLIEKQHHRKVREKKKKKMKVVMLIFLVVCAAGQNVEGL